MNILVWMKQTFDTEGKIVIQNGQLSEGGFGGETGCYHC